MSIFELSKNVEETSSASLMVNEGEALGNSGKFHEALKCFDKVLETEPYDARALIGKTKALDLLGRYEDAVEAVETAVKLKPELKVWDNDDLSELWINKGHSLNRLGRYEEAIEYYDKALEYLPEDPYTLYFKAISLNSLGSYDEAIKLLDEAIKVSDNNAEALYTKGNILDTLKKISSLFKWRAFYMASGSDSRCYNQ